MEGAQKPRAQLPESRLLDMEPPAPGTVTVQVLAAAPPPQDFLACSLSSLVYFNCCCLGLMAVVFSIKSRDRKLLGDYSGARSYGSTAKGLNIAAVVLSIIFTVIIIAIMATRNRPY